MRKLSTHLRTIYLVTRCLVRRDIPAAAVKGAKSQQPTCLIGSRKYRERNAVIQTSVGGLHESL
jgi:hypothetical protein